MAVVEVEVAEAVEGDNPHPPFVPRLRLGMHA